jgi:hypothetical protein
MGSESSKPIKETYAELELIIYHKYKILSFSLGTNNVHTISFPTTDLEMSSLIRHIHNNMSYCTRYYKSFMDDGTKNYY